jgi:hypothetical protein
LTRAALGIAACWKDGRVRVVASIRLGRIVYALGGTASSKARSTGSFPHWIRRALHRWHARFADFAITALAAFGIDRWRPDEPTPWVLKIALSAAGFDAVTFAVSFCNKPRGRGNTRPPLDIFIPLAASSPLLALPARNPSRLPLSCLRGVSGYNCP